VRDIQLTPGLNIIWSPDGATVDENNNKTIGHGSGKTLFCRLIRYCLGEDRFAPEAQRERIASKFANGLVGAEVILDGICWAIVRPLGVRRRHVAIANGDLEEIAAGEATTTGLEPFIEAVDRTLITPELVNLVRPGNEGPLWPIALAWLTRDQECRFDDVLDWRSPSSDSASPLPASGREKGPRLEALRAFLMAMTPEEHAARNSVNTLDSRYRTLEQESSHQLWEVNRRRARLVATLGLEGESLPEMPLLIEYLRKTARERVAHATQLPAGTQSELAAARAELDSVHGEWVRLDGERIRIETSIPIETRVLSEIQGELPGLSFSSVEAASPICPICEVPVDRALAEGCQLSHKLHDPAACRARWEKRKHESNEQRRILEALRQERTVILQQLALVKQKLQPLRERVSTIENARDSRESTWYSARQLQDGVERLADLYNAHEETARELADMALELDAERARVGAFRDEQSRVFSRLNDKFDPIVRRLLGEAAQGHISLSGNGIDVSIDLGGDRATAAIDSLKVLAFDLAALCLSMEGATRVPAFLLHDSPREADLGLNIYHELFRLVRELEQEPRPPLFQYIVTTTTEPPEELRADPRLRLVIRGAPPQERLLKTDL
jgi:hypothetical protein